MLFNFKFLKIIINRCDFNRDIIMIKNINIITKKINTNFIRMRIIFKRFDDLIKYQNNIFEYRKYQALEFKRLILLRDCK